MKCSNITAEKNCTCWMEWLDSITYLWQLFSIWNAERRGRKGNSKFYDNTSAAYLFICYSALCLAERDQLGPTKVPAPQLIEGLQSETQHAARNKIQTELGGISPEEVPLPEQEPSGSCWGRELMLVWQEVTSSLVCYCLYTSNTAWLEWLHEFYGCAWPYNIWTRKHYL